MALSDMFKTRSGQINAAISSDDLKAMEQLLASKFSYFGLMNRETYTPMSAPMAQLMAANIDKIVTHWFRHGIDDMPRLMSTFMVPAALQSGNAAAAAAFIYACPTFDRGNATDNHAAMLLLRMDMPEDQKMPLLRKIAAGGLSNVEKKEELLFAATDKGLTTAIDILAAAGLDPRANGEQLLRRAALAGNDAVCRHLIDKHGADVTKAASWERSLGNLDAVLLLERLRDYTAPTAPPSIESLSAEVKELRATVLELTSLLREKSIDKTPVTPVKRINTRYAPGME
jgi:hypothetical protein